MLIFLDIDGVMVPAKSWSRPEMLNDGFFAFSEKATAALQQIIGERDIVLLTTSHKASYSIQEWHAIFSARNIPVATIISLPANTQNVNRCQEIENWCLLQTVTEDLVILDDDSSLHDLPTYLKENWIQTYPAVGLTPAHLSLVQSIRSKKLQVT